jgi:hypothetical protein
MLAGQFYTVFGTTSVMGYVLVGNTVMFSNPLLGLKGKTAKAALAICREGGLEVELYQPLGIPSYDDDLRAELLLPEHQALAQRRTLTDPRLETAQWDMSA